MRSFLLKFSVSTFLLAGLSEPVLCVLRVGVDDERTKAGYALFQQTMQGDPDALNNLAKGRYFLQVEGASLDRDRAIQIFFNCALDKIENPETQPSEVASLVLVCAKKLLLGEEERQYRPNILVYYPMSWTLVRWVKFLKEKLEWIVDQPATSFESTVFPNYARVWLGCLYMDVYKHGLHEKTDIEPMSSQEKNRKAYEYLKKSNPDLYRTQFANKLMAYLIYKRGYVPEGMTADGARAYGLQLRAGFNQPRNRDIPLIEQMRDQGQQDGHSRIDEAGRPPIARRGGRTDPMLQKLEEGISQAIKRSELQGVEGEDLPEEHVPHIDQAVAEAAGTGNFVEDVIVNEPEETLNHDAQRPPLAAAADFYAQMHQENGEDDNYGREEMEIEIDETDSSYQDVLVGVGVAEQTPMGRPPLAAAADFYAQMRQEKGEDGDIENIDNEDDAMHNPLSTVRQLSFSAHMDVGSDEEDTSSTNHSRKRRNFFEDDEEEQGSQKKKRRMGTDNLSDGERLKIFNEKKDESYARLGSSLRDGLTTQEMKELVVETFPGLEGGGEPVNDQFHSIFRDFSQETKVVLEQKHITWIETFAPNLSLRKAAEELKRKFSLKPPASAIQGYIRLNLPYVKFGSNYGKKFTLSDEHIKFVKENVIPGTKHAYGVATLLKDEFLIPRTVEAIRSALGLVFPKTFFKVFSSTRPEEHVPHIDQAVAEAAGTGNFVEDAIVNEPEETLNDDAQRQPLAAAAALYAQTRQEEGEDGDIENVDKGDTARQLSFSAHMDVGSDEEDTSSTNHSRKRRNSFEDDEEKQEPQKKKRRMDTDNLSDGERLKIFNEKKEEIYALLREALRDGLTTQEMRKLVFETFPELNGGEKHFKNKIAKILRDFSQAKTLVLEEGHITWLQQHSPNLSVSNAAVQLKKKFSLTTVASAIEEVIRLKLPDVKFSEKPWKGFALSVEHVQFVRDNVEQGQLYAHRVVMMLMENFKFDVTIITVRKALIEAFGERFFKIQRS